MTENQISKAIADAAIKVNREPGGPGLPEDTEFNAKTQRRRDAAQTREAAGRYRIRVASAFLEKPLIFTRFLGHTARSFNPEIETRNRQPNRRSWSMDWYYAEGGQQRGPVQEAELENLVR